MYSGVEKDGKEGNLEGRERSSRVMDGGRGLVAAEGCRKKKRD